MKKKVKELEKKAEELEAELKTEMAEIYLTLKSPDLDEVKKTGLLGKLGLIEQMIQNNLSD